MAQHGPSPANAALPHFDVRLTAPEIGPWLAGNTGIPGFSSFTGPAAGPHIVLLAITHGNEFSGAIVLDRILRAGLRPARGKLTLGFVNIAAFARFDPRNPTLSRFVDEDMNRLWDDAILDGPRRSCELDRARIIRPLVESADLLLDLHSMLWPSEPLILCGPSRRGRSLARAAGVPELVVADHGHANGPRIIDQPRFTGPDSKAAALLLEAGQHWEPDAVHVAHASVAALLRHAGMVGDDVCLPAPIAHPMQRVAEVTDAIAAGSANFAFTQAYRGGTVIGPRGTLIATDDGREIRTPYDDCLLVMPSLRPSRGHTAVRLAQFTGA